RVRVEDVLVAGTALSGAPGDRHGDAVVDEVEVGVVARRVPGRTAQTALVRHVAPRLTAGLADRGDRVRAPQLLTGVGVVRRDPAAGVDVVAAGHALHDLAVDHDGAARVVVADRPVADLLLPGDLTGLDVQSDEVGVVRGDDQLVLVEDAVAVGGRQGGDVVDDLAPVLPEEGAVAGVDRLDV